METKMNQIVIDIKKAVIDLDGPPDDAPMSVVRSYHQSAKESLYRALTGLEELRLGLLECASAS